MTVAALAGMAAYPVQLEVSSPVQYDRVQLLLRLAISIVLGWLGITLGWLSWVLYLVLPLIAGIVVSARGSEVYLETTSTKVWPALRWLLGFGAYMLLLTDRVPLDERTGVQTELHTTGRPTAATALLRLLYSIPSAFVLCFVGIVSWVLWIVAFIAVLVTRTVPPSILAFQTGYLRWQARLLAYHASFIEEYPPFSFGERATTTPASAVSP